MIARNELWHELEKSLKSLVISISSTELDKHNRDLLDEFVENREYGIALEWLHSLIVERSIQLFSSAGERNSKTRSTHGD